MVKDTVYYLIADMKSMIEVLVLYSKNEAGAEVLINLFKEKRGNESKMVFFDAFYFSRN